MADTLQSLSSYLAQLDWKTILEDALGKLGAILVGLIVAWLVFVRHRWRLWAGDSDDIIFQSHYLVPHDNRFVLLFRTIAPPTSIIRLFDNVAARKCLKSLADRTTLQDPILRSEGSLGFEVVNDLANYLSGYLSVSSHPRQGWLMAVTCEDRKVAKKNCVRVFLIREDDLKRFLDWNWCRENLLVESPWHFFRIVALHAMAEQFNLQESARSSGEQAKAAGRSELLVAPRADFPRIRRLSLGITPLEVPVGSPAVPNWKEAVAYLQSLGMHIAVEPSPGRKDP